MTWISKQKILKNLMVLISDYSKVIRYRVWLSSWLDWEISGRTSDAHLWVYLGRCFQRWLASGTAHWAGSLSLSGTAPPKRLQAQMKQNRRESLALVPLLPLRLLVSPFQVPWSEQLFSNILPPWFSLVTDTEAMKLVHHGLKPLKLEAKISLAS